MASGYINLPVLGTATWKDPVANAAALPLTGNTTGDARITNDNQVVNVWSGSAWVAPSGSGTVTSVAMTVPAFLSISGSPIVGAGTLAVSVAAGTSGGVLGYTGATTLASSALLAVSQVMIGGGAGATPTTLSAGSQYQVLVMGASNPGYGALNLAQAAAITGILPVANGGTGLASGTSGGVLAYTASGTLASSGALTASRIVLGGGAGAAPTVLGSLGTTTTVLHGNAAGAPTFGAVSLTADVTGTLAITNGGTGQTTKAPAFDALQPMTTSGDIIYGGVSGTGTRLAKGTDGKALVLASGLPAWGSYQVAKSEVWLYSAGGIGSATTNRIVWWNSIQENTGTDIVYASDHTNGDTLTIGATGLYFAVVYMDGVNGSTFGFSLNQADLTKLISQVSVAERLAFGNVVTSGDHMPCSWAGWLTLGDVFRTVMSSSITTDDSSVFFRMVRLL